MFPSIPTATRILSKLKREISLAVLSHYKISSISHFLIISLQRNLDEI